MRKGFAEPFGVAEACGEAAKARGAVKSRTSAASFTINDNFMIGCFSLLGAMTRRRDAPSARLLAPENKLQIVLPEDHRLINTFQPYQCKTVLARTI